MSTHGLTILFLLALMLGVFLGYESTFASEVAVTVFFLFVVQSIIFFFASKLRRVNSVISLATVIMCVAICIGIIRVQLVEEKPSIVCEQSCTISGKIVRTPQVRDTYQLFTVRADSEHAYVQVYAPLYPKRSAGERVEIVGAIKKPSTIFPHQDKKGFDYISYLENDGVGSQSMFPRIVVLDTKKQSVSDYLFYFKHSLSERLNHFISYPANTLSVGMLFGESSMPKELTEAFRRTGVSHIVVLSGFNIALVISFILFLFRFVPLVVRIAISFISVCAFVLMVGAEASIIRATIMASISLFAVLIGRQYIAKQALILSLIAITLYDPKLLFSDVSLHLSFIATAGIIYLMEPIAIVLKHFKLPDTLRTIIETTLAAYVATLPYQMYVFGSVSPYAILANILIVPLVPIAMLLSFITACVSLMGDWAGVLFGSFTSLFLDGMIVIIRLIASLPVSMLPVQLPLLGMIISYVILVTLAQYVVIKSHETPLDASGITKDETIYRF